MAAKEEVEKLLKAHKAVLLRGKKHLVYQLDNGERFVTPNTPSDTAAWDNNLSDLKRILGLTSQHKEGVRRSKKRTPKPKITPDWLTALPRKEGELPPTFKSEWVPPSPQPEPEDEGKPIRNPLYVKEGFWQRKSARTLDKGFSYSPEVLRHANFICRTEGDQAMHNYLNRIRSGAPMENVNGNSKGSLGSIEQLLAQFQQERQSWVGKKSEAEREIIRCDIVIENLEKTLDLVTTPSTALKIKQSDKSDWHERRSKWMPVVSQLLSNGPMPRKNFIENLLKEKPGTTRNAIQTMLCNWVRRNKIVQNDGMISLVQ